MGKYALPCIVCEKPLVQVDEDAGENQPYGGTEFVTLGHYGSTIHDELGEDQVRMKLIVNICDTCILRAIDKDVIQSRGEDGTPLQAHHHIDDESRHHVLMSNEKQYGSAWGEDKPYAPAYEESVGS